MVIEYLSPKAASNDRVWRGVVNEAMLESPEAVAAQKAFMETVEQYVGQLVDVTAA